jgi:hypothetical protein
MKSLYQIRLNISLFVILFIVVFTRFKSLHNLDPANGTKRSVCSDKLQLFLQMYED